MTNTSTQFTSELSLLQQTVDSQAERIRCLENLVDHMPLHDTTMRLHKSPPIEIPPHVADEVEKVRYMLGVPGVVIVLSGDAVARVGWPSFDTADRRGALVYNLARLCSASSATGQVIFDGNLGNSCPPSLYDHSLEVRLSHPPVSSDQAVHELVQTYPKKMPLVVVSGNRALKAVSMGRANHVDVEFFLDLFLARAPG